MSKLDECRIKIDEIDTQIIKLYEERMKVVKGVIEYKLDHNIPILDSDREKAMLDKNIGKIENDEYKKYYLDVLKGFLTASKAMQKDILDSKK